MTGRMIPKLQGSEKVSDRKVRLSGSLEIQNEGGFSPWCLDAFLERTGRVSSEGGFALLLKRQESLAAEAYHVTVSEKEIEIEAASEQGVIWALTSLTVFLQQEMLPLGEWRDEPSYSHRGLCLDTEGRYFPVAELRFLIDAMSLAKLNVLHLRLCGEKAFRIRSEAYPSLAGGEEAYTLLELSELALYARSRGVTLVPEVSLPGTASAILKAMPKLGCSSGAHSLCAGQNQTYDFAKGLLSELAPLFPSEYFHLGGRWADLSAWRACPYCQAKMIAQGSVSVTGLEGYFIGRCAKHLGKFGKKAVVYNDALTRDLPRDVIVQYDNPAGKEEMNSFMADGGKFIDSDVFDLFYNFPHAMTPLERAYQLPVPFMQGKKAPAGLLGFEAVLFTDKVLSFRTAQELLFPRLYALAERTWAGSGQSDYAEFLQRLSGFLSQAQLRSLLPTRPEGYDPQGGDRKREAISYAKGLSGEPWPWLTSPASQECVTLFKKKFFRPMDLLIMPKGIL